MKKLFLSCSIIFLTIFSNAQNVAINNDGSSASGSAILDVKSTAKGLMMPRMSSAQRVAIVSPELGLLVFDTDTKTIWAYEGNSWKNLYTSGGALTLPFSQTVNSAISAFQVANQGTGAAIEGSSSAQFGIGMIAKTTGDGGWGLSAFSNGAGAQSIRSYADNGTAFHGENNNPANTNTLVNLLNKGLGNTLKSQLANANSISPNMLIAGNNLGHQLKIYQTNAANTESAVSVENSGTGTGVHSTSTSGAAILGESNTGYGVKGVTNTATGFAGVYGQNTGTAGSGVVGSSNAVNTQGVYGLSTNGIAVRALGDNYRAVQATSNTGTALYGSSTSGYALEINGNVKIAGGNTNPSNGATLTSDANGNAVWKSSSKIAFSVTGINNSYRTYPAHVYDVVHLFSEEFDYGNRYAYYGGATPSFGNSVFVSNKTGVYHFDALVGLESANGTNDIFNVALRIKIIRVINGVAVNIIAATTEFSSGMRSIKWMGEARISKDIKLVNGDIVFLEIENSSDTDYVLNIYADTEPHFGCHLVFEE